MSSSPTDSKIYEKAKKIVYKQYEKPSAYRSGALVKEYKKLFYDKYGDTKKPYQGKKTDKQPLTRWFDEKWQDINPNKTNETYPVYRPTIKVNKETPKTVDEISKQKLNKQIKLKQKIKDKKNLPKF